MNSSRSLLQITPLVFLLFFSLACSETATDAYSNAEEAVSDIAESAAETAEGVVEKLDGDAILAPSNQFNLNTASNDDFNQIPGMNDHMLHEFDEYRPYSSIADFRKELAKYIDADQIAAYEKYLYVPVDMNESDAVSLQQIPGVSEALSMAIIAGRPYDSADAFMAKAKSLIPGFDAEKAAAFLVK